MNESHTLDLSIWQKPHLRLHEAVVGHPNTSHNNIMQEEGGGVGEEKRRGGPLMLYSCMCPMLDSALLKGPSAVLEGHRAEPVHSAVPLALS